VQAWKRLFELLQGMSQKLFFRAFEYQKRDMARFLTESQGFDVLYRSADPPETKRTKLFFVTQTLLDLAFLLKRRATIKRYDHILALWHTALAFMLLKRLGLISYDKLLWFGFSVHGSFWTSIYKQIVKLDREKTWFAVFTEQEIETYQKNFGIDPVRLLFIHHGDWPQPIEVPHVFGPDPDLDLETPFYFAGGFTNRDYQPVIETFRRSGKRLIIVCSQTNEDVVEADLPENIRVYRDITFPEFELLLKASKGVIISLKHDAGAAGHSVLVRSMRNAKIVIANDFRIMHDYVDHGVDGVLLKDLEQELGPTIEDIERHPENFVSIQAAAQDRFEANYSQKALEDGMSELVMEKWLQNLTTTA